MSAPVYVGLGDPSATVTLQPPVESDETVQQIVALLLAAYSIKKTADLLHALIPSIDVMSWVAALKLTRTTHTPRARLAKHLLDRTTPGADVARSTARREVFYRAAYVAKAASRIQREVNHGEKLPQAVRGELSNFRAHEQARTGRLDAAAKVGNAANQFGDLLGWYLDPLLNNDPECIEADGHNFHASEGTIIGLPGAVHRYCGCTAGPPYEGAKLVNDAIAASRTVTSAPRKVGIRVA